MGKGSKVCVLTSEQFLPRNLGELKTTKARVQTPVYSYKSHVTSPFGHGLTVYGRWGPDRTPVVEETDSVLDAFLLRCRGTTGPPRDVKSPPQEPETRNLKPDTRNPKPWSPYTLNTTPYTLHPFTLIPYTLNPIP